MNSPSIEAISFSPLLTQIKSSRCGGGVAQIFATPETTSIKSLSAHCNCNRLRQFAYSYRKKQQRCHRCRRRSEENVNFTNMRLCLTYTFCQDNHKSSRRGWHLCQHHTCTSCSSCLKAIKYLKSYTFYHSAQLTQTLKHMS